MERAELKTATLEWIVEGYVECPHCQGDNDFIDEDEFYGVCQVAEAKDFHWPYLMTCKHCHKEFNITKSTY